MSRGLSVAKHWVPVKRVQWHSWTFDLMSLAYGNGNWDNL